MPPRPRPLAERLWSRTEHRGECLIFTGPVDAAGYGKIGAGFRGGKILLTHRVAYELARGPIPDGLHVCHSCDTPACVLPAHLFLGTRSDNMLDCANKDRCRVPGVTTTAAQRRTIITRYLAGETSRALAAEFSVSAKAVENLVYRHRRRQSRAASQAASS